MKYVWRLAALALGAGLLCAAANSVQAQGYPNKPIRIIVPYPPAGFNDTLARTVGQKLTDAWGQPVVVDNRPGGGTLIGTDLVAKAAPDGHTLLITPFAFAVNPSIFKKLPYDPIKDFAPITLAASTPNLLVVNPAVPVKSVKELLATAKSNPAKLNYASTGTGSSNHLSMEKFKQMAGVDIVHVPYKGSAPAVTDLIGGQVNLMFDNIPNVLPHVKAGKLRALAVTSPQRSPHVPDVPTVIEGGVPGYEVTVWFGISAPAGTPEPVLTKLNTEIVKILNMPDVKERFAAQGVDSIGSTPGEFAAHIKAQMAAWAKVVKDSGVTPE
jgi:tripartite-type tricarboxylate transporter receptor subunit TctC